MHSTKKVQFHQESQATKCYKYAASWVLLKWHILVLSAWLFICLLPVLHLHFKDDGLQNLTTISSNCLIQLNFRKCWFFFSIFFFDNVKEICSLTSAPTRKKSQGDVFILQEYNPFLSPSVLLFSTIILPPVVFDVGIGILPQRWQIRNEIRGPSKGLVWMWQQVNLNFALHSWHCLVFLISIFPHLIHDSRDFKGHPIPLKNECKAKTQPRCNHVSYELQWHLKHKVDCY